MLNQKPLDHVLGAVDIRDFQGVQFHGRTSNVGELETKVAEKIGNSTSFPLIGLISRPRLLTDADFDHEWRSLEMLHVDRVLIVSDKV